MLDAFGTKNVKLTTKMNMRIFTIQIVLMFLNRSDGSDTTDNYDCHGQICILKGYDLLESPINEDSRNTIGAGKVTWVYFNFFAQNDLVKRVDYQKMTITFQATAIMIWEDPRLKIESQISEYAPLPDLVKEHIWTPKLTVDRFTHRQSSLIKHPANYRKICANN